LASRLSESRAFRTARGQDDCVPRLNR
jgi:hypothetical protein